MYSRPVVCRAQASFVILLRSRRLTAMVMLAAGGFAMYSTHLQLLYSPCIGCSSELHQGNLSVNALPVHDHRFKVSTTILSPLSLHSYHHQHLLLSSSASSLQQPYAAPTTLPQHGSHWNQVFTTVCIFLYHHPFYYRILDDMHCLACMSSPLH